MLPALTLHEWPCSRPAETFRSLLKQTAWAPPDSLVTIQKEEWRLCSDVLKPSTVTYTTSNSPLHETHRPTLCLTKTAGRCALVCAIATCNAAYYGAEAETYHLLIFQLTAHKAYQLSALCMTAQNV